MAIDYSGMLMKLNPLSAIDAGKGMGMERERMRLMREEFEQRRREHEDDKRLMEMREAGEMKRAELALQQQREKDAEAAKAKLLEQKRGAMAEFEKYRQSGDIEGVEAMVPRMFELGMGVERLGEDEGGLPTYQIDMDGEEAEKAEAARAAQASPYDEPPAGAAGSMEEAAMGPPGGAESAVQSLDRLGALGYPSLSERGNLDEPALDEPISTFDAFERGLKATEHYGKTKEPLRGPDEADLMGSVPKNVYDFGAMNQQALRRLNPALGAFADAHPEGMQDSVEATNRAAAGLGLPVDKAMELAQKLRTGPDAAMARQDAAAQAATGREATAGLAKAKGDRTDKNTGFENAKYTAKELGVGDVYGAQKSAQMIEHLLTNDDEKDDMAIAFQMTQMLGSIGPQSNKDVAVAIGLESSATVDQIREKVEQIIFGGYTEMRKDTLLGIVKRAVEVDDEKVYGLLDVIDENIASPGLTEGERQGWRNFRRTIPKAYRDAHDGTGDEEEDEEEETPTAPGGAPARMGRTTVSRPGSRDHELAAMAGVDEEEEEAAEEAGVAPPDGDDDGFEATLYETAAMEGLDAEAMLPIISGESGGKGSAANKTSSAKGVLQFLNSTARRYGFKDSAEFAALPRTEQIPYVVQYFKDAGLDADSTPEDYAVAVAAPAFVGKPPETVVYPEGSKAWEQNAPWRPADGGDITVGSIAAYYRRNAKGKAKAAEPEEETEETEEGEELAAESELDRDVLNILR